MVIVRGHRSNPIYQDGNILNYHMNRHSVCYTIHFCLLMNLATEPRNRLVSDNQKQG